jgi:hypothetical protein
MMTIQDMKDEFNNVIEIWKNKQTEIQEMINSIIQIKVN